MLNHTIAAVLRDESEPLDTALGTLAPAVPEELHTALKPLTRDAESDCLPTSGYVIHSLQTALQESLRASDPEAAIAAS